MTLDTQSTDIYKLFTAVESFFQKTAFEKNLKMKFIVSKELHQNLLMDKLRFKQIIINLIGNALKFTPEGGDVSVRVFSEGDILHVIIKDSGIGIAPRNVEKIFHSFEQEDSSITRNFGGTGLGLSISKKIALLMDGDIKVLSTLGKGSEFYVSVPYLKSSEEEHKVDSAHIDRLSQGIRPNSKILVVEDNKTNQLLLSLILDGYELSYDIVNDGIQSLEKFNKVKYDLILMDENMPNMNGIEAVKRIRKLETENNLKPTQIIAVTANALSGDKQVFLDAGMDDYLAKPYHEEDIKHILYKYLN